MDILNEIKRGEIYRHLNGTLVKVLNVNTLPAEEGGEVVRGITFVEKDFEGEVTPNWMSEEDFASRFFVTKLYPGMKILMVSMGKILGETELEETEDENILRAKHAGELFHRYTDKNNNLQMVYCPKESSAIGFTIAEAYALAARRKKIISEIQREVREFEEKLNEIGELSNIDLNALKESVHRRIERTLAQIESHDEK